MPLTKSKKKPTACQSAQYWPHHLFVPSAVSNLPALLTSCGWSQLEIDNHQDKVAYVLNLILTAKAFGRTISHDGYVNISQRILGDVIGPRYVQKVLSVLRETGVIESDGKYYNWGDDDNAKALGYRITGKVQSPAVGLLVFKQEVFGKRLAKLHREEEVELRKNRFLNRIYRDIKQLRIRYAEAQDFNDTTHTITSRFLAQHFPNLNTTVFNGKAYTALLSEAFTQDSVHIVLPTVKTVRKSFASRSSNEPGTTVFDVLTRLVLAARNANHTAITKIHNQDFKIPKRDEQSPGEFARVYTNLTNLGGDFRQFLYCVKADTERLVNIDIKNSQPFLLCLLLIKEYGQNTLPKDVQRYIELTSTGEFYNTVSRELGMVFRNEREKRQFKVWFFGSVFFCKNLHSKNSKAGKYFQKNFENVYEVICKYKKENHRHLALVMQREEASLMLDEVVKTLHEKKIWNASIHDSIVCWESQASEVKGIILEAFQMKYQLVPSLEAKSFCEDEGEEVTLEDFTMELDFDEDDYPFFHRIAC